MWLLWYALLLCVCAWWWNMTRRSRRLLGGLPSFPQLPLIGNIHLLSRDSRLLFRLLERMSDTCEETNKPFVFWFGPQPVLIITDAEDVKAVNNAFIEKPYYYRLARRWLGDGLVIAPSEIWKRNIKKLSGIFTTSVVDGYQDVFCARAADLVEKLRSRSGAPFDVMHDLANTTLEAICQTALGFPKISESIVTKEYYDAFNRCLELLIQRGLNPLLHLDCIYKLTPGYREMEDCVTTLHHISHTVIKKRILEREHDKNKNNETKNTRFKSYLDLLLDMQEGDSSLSDDQLRAEVDTVILGGHETVATTLQYTLLMIARDTKLQEKIYNEVREVLDQGNRPVSVEDLPRLQYCEAVLLETLRVFPPFPLVMRHADKDLRLSSGKCVVPRGAMCAVSALVMSRARRYWGADAALYRPERWLTHRPAPPAAFLAFSYGRRACIGKTYAMAILKTLLATCVRELEFSSETSDLQLKIDIVLRPSSGHLLSVKTRY